MATTLAVYHSYYQMEQTINYRNVRKMGINNEKKKVSAKKDEHYVQWSHKKNCENPSNN